MTDEILKKIATLPKWQIQQTDEACRTLASEYAKTGVTNEALLSFLNLFGTACLLCDEKFLFFLHELYLFGTGQAMNGDKRAEKVVSGLNDTLRELADVELHDARRRHEKTKHDDAPVSVLPKLPRIPKFEH